MDKSDRMDYMIDELVFPITISTPFAVGDVYSYLIKDEKIVLVDCGHYSESSYRQVRAALAEQGLKIEDIDEIWLTHGHPDHFGQAARLAGESGAVIKGHPKERGNFACRDNRDLFKTFFSRHHIPEQQIGMMIEQLDWLQQFQQPVEPEWIEEDEGLSSGTLNFKVRHTPGHAPGHVVFYSQDGLLFGGDVLLEHISTNALINFETNTGARNKSLLQYRESLQWMENQNGVVLPGHGKQIPNIGDVAARHISEQNKRFEQIKKALNKQPQGLIPLSQLLFADALKQGEHFLVFSEIIGYLDWGEQEGTIVKEETGGGIIFSGEHQESMKN